MDKLGNNKNYSNKTFEDIRHIDKNGNEYWSARELQTVLDYKEWRKFEGVVQKAIKACKNSDINTLDHFGNADKMVEIGSGAKRIKKDYKLTRYACYLIAQNGDPRKEVIALGQTYFAIQTRRQEVADYFNQLDEYNKRLVIRGDIKQWNQMLLEAAHNAGVITNYGIVTINDRI